MRRARHRRALRAFWVDTLPLSGPLAGYWASPMANYRSELRDRLRARIAELEAAMGKSSVEVRRVAQQLRRAGGRYGFPQRLVAHPGNVGRDLG